MGKTHVALFRGINVGGNNLIPMKSLAAMFEDAGCTSVRTYIQSGNVVFEAAPALAKRVPAIVSARVAKKHGHEPTIVTCTSEELAEVASKNPFADRGDDQKLLYVGFLAREPSKSAVAALDPNRSPGDEYVVRGRAIYMSLRTGAAKTKLTNAYFDSKLATTSTVRNWRTVQKLVEISAPRSAASR